MTRAFSSLLVASCVALSLVLAGCGPAEGEGAAHSASASDPAPRLEAPAVQVPRPAVAEIATPAGPLSLAPELTLVGGQPALSWIERAEDGAELVRYARLPTGPGAAAADAVTVVPSEPGGSVELFANWADRPGVVQGGAGPDGPLYAWWLAKSGDSTYAYSVELARSTDGGASWQPLGRLHGDPTPAEHGFVTLIPEGEGVRAFWLDGRATVAGKPMTLRTARVTDRVERETEELLDASVCDCCNTTAVATADGPLVVYRDRTGDEIRDHSVVRRTAEGWSEPSRLHDDGWKIAACPVNGPAAAVSGDSLWVAWFTGADGEARVRAARSTDGGLSFGEPVLVDGKAPLGRLDLEPDGAGGAVVSWLATTETAEGREAAVHLRRLGADGRLGPPVEVARAGGSRATGVPRLLAHDDRLLVAWVEPAEGSRAGRVRVVSLAASEVPPPG